MSVIPTTTVTIDDRTWTLVEDFNAYVAFEEETGLDALNYHTFVRPVVDADGRVMHDAEGRARYELNLTASQFRAYLWALLRREHEGVSISQVGEMLADARWQIEARAAFQRLAIQSFEQLATLGEQPGGWEVPFDESTGSTSTASGSSNSD